MSAVLSLLQSRLLRPVFVTLGIALLVQVLVAVALTRSTVTALEADLGERCDRLLERLLHTRNRFIASQQHELSKDLRRTGLLVA